MGEVQKQFDYYLANQDALVERYNGKHIVIAGEKVVGDFDSELEAYRFASSQLAPGSFVIQFVSPGSGSYSQTFHSRVAL